MCTSFFSLLEKLWPLMCAQRSAKLSSGLGSLPAAAHAFRQQIQGENQYEKILEDCEAHLADRIIQNTTVEFKNEKIFWREDLALHARMYHIKCWTFWEPRSTMVVALLTTKTNCWSRRALSSLRSAVSWSGQFQSPNLQVGQISPGFWALSFVLKLWIIRITTSAPAAPAQLVESFKKWFYHVLNILSSIWFCHVW